MKTQAGSLRLTIPHKMQTQQCIMSGVCFMDDTASLRVSGRYTTCLMQRL
jgi:hypothetical protein